MIRNILEDYKTLIVEFLGLIGGILWAINTDWKDYEPIILMVISFVGLIIGIVMRLSPHSKNKITKKSFYREFNELAKITLKQSVIFKSMSEEILNFKTQEWKLEILANLKNAEARISKYDQHELQLILPNSLNHILNIFENVKLIDLQLSNCEKIIERTLSKVNENKIENTKSIQTIASLIQTHLARIGGTVFQNDPFLYGAVAIYNKHMEVANDFHVLFGKDSFIGPLNELCQNHRNDERAIQIQALVNRSSNCLKEVERGMKHLSEHFLELERQFKEINESLLDELKYFS